MPVWVHKSWRQYLDKIEVDRSYIYLKDRVDASAYSKQDWAEVIRGPQKIWPKAQWVPNLWPEGRVWRDTGFAIIDPFYEIPKQTISIVNNRVLGRAPLQKELRMPAQMIIGGVGWMGTLAYLTSQSNANFEKVEVGAEPGAELILSAYKNDRISSTQYVFLEDTNVLHNYLAIYRNTNLKQMNDYNFVNLLSYLLKNEIVLSFADLKLAADTIAGNTGSNEDKILSLLKKQSPFQNKNAAQLKSIAAFVQKFKNEDNRLDVLNDIIDVDAKKFGMAEKLFYESILKSKSEQELQISLQKKLEKLPGVTGKQARSITALLVKSIPYQQLTIMKKSVDAESAKELKKLHQLIQDWQLHKYLNREKSLPISDFLEHYKSALNERESLLLQLVTEPNIPLDNEYSLHRVWAEIFYEEDTETTGNSLEEIKNSIRKMMLASAKRGDILTEAVPIADLYLQSVRDSRLVKNKIQRSKQVAALPKKVQHIAMRSEIPGAKDTIESFTIDRKIRLLNSEIDKYTEIFKNPLYADLATAIEEKNISDFAVMPVFEIYSKEVSSYVEALQKSPKKFIREKNKERVAVELSSDYICNLRKVSESSNYLNRPVLNIVIRKITLDLEKCVSLEKTTKDLVSQGATGMRYAEQCASQMFRSNFRLEQSEACRDNNEVSRDCVESVSKNRTGYNACFHFLTQQLADLRYNFKGDSLSFKGLMNAKQLQWQLMVAPQCTMRSQVHNYFRKSKLSPNIVNCENNSSRKGSRSPLQR